MQSCDQVNMEASPKQKFEAAVKVIQSLPKNGSFQPSHEMMLRFYGFYKQATEGQCTLSKPGFWDVVKKAKWEAWSKLGEMPRERAMINYVEELKQIIETMPQTHMVAEFVNKLGSFYEIVEDKSPIDIGRNKNRRGSTGSTPRDSSQSSEHSDEKSDGFSEMSIEGLIKQTGIVNDVPDAIPDYSKYYPEQLHINGEIEEKTPDTEVIPRQKTSADSDTDDEFCDSSDQPVKTSKVIPNVSTPLKNQSGVLPIQRSQAKYMNMSPIAPSKNPLTFHNNVPFLDLPRQQHTVSDSLVVNCSTDSENIMLTDSYSVKQPNGDISMNSDLNDSFVEKTVELQRGCVKARGGGSDLPHRGDSGEQVSGRTRVGQGQNEGLRQNPSYVVGQFANPHQQLSSGGGSGNGGEFPLSGGNINETIVLTLQKLQQDMYNVSQRVTILEQKYKRDGLWWHFSTLKGKIFLIVVWPILVHLFLTFLFSRRKHSKK